MIHMMLLIVEIVIHTCIYHIYTTHTLAIKGYGYILIATPSMRLQGLEFVFRVQGGLGRCKLSNPEPLLGVDINSPPIYIQLRPVLNGKGS